MASKTPKVDAVDESTDKPASGTARVMEGAEEMRELEAEHLSKAEISFLNKVKSTKFTMSMFVITLITLLLVTAKLTAPIFSEIIQFVVGAYILGNVFTKSKWSK